MQKVSDKDKLCNDNTCEYGLPPVGRPHYHVRTNDGGYIRYIVEKPKEPKFVDYEA